MLGVGSRTRHCAGAMLTLVLIAACGSASSSTNTPSPSPSPTATPASTPTPAPTPSADAGRDAIEITATGLGAYLETAVPVAIVHNLSLAHEARNVTVHFRVLTPSGAEAGSADTVVARLLPDQTAAISARVAASARGDRTEATVSAQDFVPAPSPAGAPEQVTGISVSCPQCSSGGGSGDAVGTLALSASGGSTRLLEAACTDSGGAIIGGGSAEVSAGAGPTMSVDVPVILSSPSQTCRIDAFPGGF
jgi:hypothetical protein